MNDPPAPVQNDNNNPQPEVNNNANNANDQPPPPPRRNIYNFGPVKLQWEDFLSSVDELSHINKLPKTGQPLDILSLGCSTISKGRDQPGRIVTIDVEMTNLQPKIEGKIRLVEKILRICSTFLRQDPEGVAGQVFDICANAMIEIYQSNSHLIQTLQPFYWRELLSTIKYSVDENKELGAGMRLGLCNIIADLEETEQGSKSKLQEENGLTQYLREVTHNEREQVELMQKIALLLPLDEVSAADSALMEALREQPQHRSYTVDELTKLFEALFSEVSVGLLDSTLDVLMALSRRVTCTLDILEIGNGIKTSILAGLSEESDRVIVFGKLMELLRVLIFCNLSTQRITEVFTELVPASIKALEAIKNTSDFSQKTICKMIELYCLAAERDLDLTDVSRQILPNIINSSSKIDGQDAVLKELFNYASFALCSKDPVSFLKSGLDSVFQFVRTGLGEEFANDSEVVCTCLELASLFIRQKAEPQGLLSFFEIQMTNSFEVPSKWDCGDQAFKRSTLLDVLKQGLVVIQNGINRYKYFIFYMPPIYTMIEELPIDNFLKKAGNPAEKDNVHRRRMELLREVVQILIEEVKKGNDISILLSDALPMVFDLYGINKYVLAAPDQPEGQTAEQMPVEGSADVPTAAPAKRSLRTAQRVTADGESKSELNRDATHEIINRLRFVIVKYESNNDYALLLLLKSCYDFALRNFNFFNPRKIGEVFRNLLDKGQRDHLKGFIRICNSELNDAKYQSIRNYIFGDAGLSSRNFEELCKVLAMIFDLRKFQNEAVNKIIVRIVASLEECLITNSFTVEMAKDLTERINRLILFKNLFGDELEKNKDKSAEELNDIFQSKFPQDMIQDEFMMKLLTSLSLRIERITFALPKWKHVADFTVDLLNKFFAIELPNDPALSTNEAKIKYRREMLDKMVFDLPKNHEMRKYLASLGYSESLWEKDVWLDVEVEDRKNIEENFKAALIGIYGEYVDIYKTLYPSSEKINIDGREFELDRVFADDRENTTLDDLKSRRNVFLKAIDKRIKNHPRKAFIVNRKLSLLTREDQLEADVEQQKLQEKLEPAQKRRYWCRFNNTFVNSANCCSKNIVGCYAPDGDHAEKPIENSLKANLGFISVYDTEGTTPMSHEIENAEVLFTDQGLFIYKIYTNGHSYDTSLVWTSMFKALVESGLVPAIIIPRGFPNNRTFCLFESMIPTELVGGIITYKDDFFEEAGVESYFDFKAAKIQPGDVILTDKNVQLLKLPDLSVAKEQHKGKTLLRRSTGTLAVNKDNKPKPKAYNSIRKDLAGVVMTRVILKLKADSNSQLSDNVEAFARFLSQYITLYIEFGIRDFEILTVGFDLDQWIKRKGKKKGKKPMTKEEKESLIKRILQIIHGEIEALFESQTKLKSLFARNKEQFFELQQHLLQVVKNLHRDLAVVKAEVQQTRLAQQRQRNVMQQGANNEAQQPGDGQQSGPDIKADNKETAQITMTEEEIKLEQQKAVKALNEIKTVLKKSTVTVRIGDLRPQMQIFAMKWIFGNEDRVWRDRGGRPGEETLQSFINFVTVPKSGQEPVQPANTNNAVAPTVPSNPVANSTQPAPQAKTEPEEEDEDEPKDEFSRSEMRLDHYGNAPFGGFIEFTRKSLPPTDDKAKDDVDNESLEHFGFTNLNIYELDTLEKVDMVGYCVGDYIEKDNFEVVTAWVHPAFRSIGVAWKLYEITIDEIHRRGGKYMTYDILQGSLERVIRSSPVLSICRMLGITDLCVVKRRKSYANQTSMGTEEQFERIRANVKWILMGKKALEAKRKADQLVQKLKFWKLKHVSHDDKFEGILSVL